MSSWVLTLNSNSYEIAEFIIGGVIPIVLIVVGTLGNLLCAFILLNKENRRTSTNVYLVFLCIMDTLSLYQWNLHYAVYSFTGGKQQITDQSLFLCKWGVFLSYYTSHTSAMFLTLVSLDRACLLWNGWYKRKIARPRVALMVCVIILLVLFGINGFLFGFGVEYTTYNNSTGTQMTVVECYYSLDANFNQFYANQYLWIHLVLMYFVPFTLMLVCTILTMNKLIFKRRTDNQQLAQNARRNRHISIMLLLMCLTYVILTLPNRLCFSIFQGQIIGHEYADTVFLASNTLMYTRNALNALFLYKSVYGLRRDVRTLMLKCYRKLRHRVVPLETNGGTYIATIATVRDAAKSAPITIPMKTFHL